MQKFSPIWWWLIMLFILIILGRGCFYLTGGDTKDVIKIKPYPVDKKANFCQYKVDTLLGKEDNPADTGLSTYKKGEQLCLLCKGTQQVCEDSLTVEDPQGRQYGISLIITGATVPTCGSCKGTNTRKIQRR